MAGLFDSKDSLDPGYDFVRAWVGRLVQVDATILQILFQGSLERSGAGWDWSVVVGKNIHFMVIFQ
jgi:hypothetical protein